MKKFLLLGIALGVMILAPVTSYAASVTYEEAKPANEINASNSVEPNNAGKVAAEVGRAALGWAVAKVLDAATQIEGDASWVGERKCLSIPEETKEDLKEAFGR